MTCHQAFSLVLLLLAARQPADANAGSELLLQPSFHVNRSDYLEFTQVWRQASRPAGDHEEHQPDTAPQQLVLGCVRTVDAVTPERVRLTLTIDRVSLDLATADGRLLFDTDRHKPANQPPDPLVARCALSLLGAELKLELTKDGTVRRMRGHERLLRNLPPACRASAEFQPIRELLSVDHQKRLWGELYSVFPNARVKPGTAWEQPFPLPERTIPVTYAVAELHARAVQPTATIHLTADFKPQAQPQQKTDQPVAASTPTRIEIAGTAQIDLSIADVKHYQRTMTLHQQTRQPPANGVVRQSNTVKVQVLRVTRQEHGVREMRKQMRRLQGAGSRGVSLTALLPAERSTRETPDR